MIKLLTIKDNTYIYDTFSNRIKRQYYCNINAKVKISAGILISELKEELKELSLPYRIGFYCAYRKLLRLQMTDPDLFK